MRNKIIFIGGIHGVGKTSLCEELSNRTGAHYFSASKLIKRLKKDYCDNKNKAVKDIDGNQELLLTAINQYIDKNLTTLLDGHFCLLSSTYEVARISKKTFDDISPIAIIVLYDSISSISSKIANRDDVKYDVNLLSSFQNEEINYSKNIAGKLKIPYLLFDVSHDKSEIVDFITNLTNMEIQ